MEDAEEEALVRRERWMMEMKLGVSIHFCSFTQVLKNLTFKGKMRSSMEEEEAQIEEKPQEENNKVQEVLNAYENSRQLVDLMREIERSKELQPSVRETSWRPLRFYSQVRLSINTHI